MEVWAALSAPSFWVAAIVSAAVGRAVSWAFGTRRVAPVLMIASDSRALDDPGLTDVK